MSRGVGDLSFSTLSADLGVTMYKYKFRIPAGYTLLVRSLAILEGIALASDPNYKVLGAAYPWVARSLLTDTSPELRATLRELLYYDDGSFRFDRLESLLEQALKSPAAYRERVSTSRDASTSATTATAGPVAPVAQPAAQAGSADAFLLGGPAAALRRLANSVSEITGIPLPLPPVSITAADDGERAALAVAAQPAGPAPNDPLALLLSEGGDFVLDIVLDELAKGIDAFWRLNLDSVQSSVSLALRSALGAAPRAPEPTVEKQRGNASRWPREGNVPLVPSRPSAARTRAPDASGRAPVPGAFLYEFVEDLPKLVDSSDLAQVRRAPWY